MTNTCLPVFTQAHEVIGVEEMLTTAALPPAPALLRGIQVNPTSSLLRHLFS
jgi:hypothetical protein